MKLQQQQRSNYGIVASNRFGNTNQVAQHHHLPSQNLNNRLNSGFTNNNGANNGNNSNRRPNQTFYNTNSSKTQQPAGVPKNSTLGPQPILGANAQKQVSTSASKSNTLPMKTATVAPATVKPTVQKSMPETAVIKPSAAAPTAATTATNATSADKKTEELSSASN